MALTDGVGDEGSFEAGKLAAPMRYRPGTQLASLTFASPDAPPRPGRMTTVAPPAPPRPVRITSAAAFCSQMGRPDMPPVNWRGTALLRVVAETSGGRARVIGFESKLTPPDAVAEGRLREAVRAAVNETYVCSGLHTFEQEFQFVVE